MLTKRQKQILNYIEKFIKKNDYAPSLEEIKGHFKLKSVSTIHQHIEALKSKGFLHKLAHQHRTIELTSNNQKSKLSKILLMGTIPAGGPIEPIRNPKSLEVPRSMLSRAGRHYALRVSGTSMIEDGVFDGDIIVVHEQPVVESGEAAVAYLPDKNEVTLKKLYREKNRIRLQPANKKMEPLYEKNVEIQGKIVGILREIA